MRYVHNEGVINIYTVLLLLNGRRWRENIEYYLRIWILKIILDPSKVTTKRVILEVCVECTPECTKFD